jgi:glucosylceramidase
MKTNENRVGGKMKGIAGDAYHKSYALYLNKFLDSYRESANVTIWGLTVQNEPLTPTLYGWDSCQFLPEEERDFVKLDLGPALKQYNPDVKLMVHDDQRTHLPDYVETIMSDPDARKYVDGIGMHWYGSVNDIIVDVAPLLNKTFTEFPSLFGLATEACNGYLPFVNGPKPGDWTYGEYYSRDMIIDFNNFVSGWTDWNLLLDQQGGPNHAGNFVDAPILVYSSSPTDPNAYILKNPMFYHLAHFSKFIHLGDKKIHLDSTSNIPFIPPIESVAFVSSDNQTVTIVLLNRDGVSGRNYSIKFNNKYYNGNIDKSSITTLVFNNQ